MNKLFKNIYPWFFVAGILFIALGIKIIITGELKDMIQLGQSKYFVGGASILAGIYTLFNSLKNQSE